MKSGFFVYFLILGVVINRGFSIRITRFVVPAVASFGALLDLDCAYDLENDQLYDVKWYKDTDEFFRCKSNGEVQVFEVEGIKLFHNQKATLGSCPVTLTILNSNSAGQYRCEISTEAPEFKTTARFDTLRISNIKPSKRIQNNGTLAVTETSTIQRNGSRSGIFSSTNFAYIIFLYFICCLKINVVWFYDFI